MREIGAASNSKNARNWSPVPASPLPGIQMAHAWTLAKNTAPTRPRAKKKQKHHCAKLVMKTEGALNGPPLGIQDQSPFMFCCISLGGEFVYEVIRNNSLATFGRDTIHF